VKVINNTFDAGAENWCSYDYARSVESKIGTVFVLAGWRPSGGVDGKGFILAHHTHWSVDVPESPISVLPLMSYLNWELPRDRQLPPQFFNVETTSFENCKVSLYLQGWDLKLKSAECFFWIEAVNGTRWHCVAHPLTIGTDEWAHNEFPLTLEGWHNSWRCQDNFVFPFELLIRCVRGWGISFVGFTEPVTGVIGMDSFCIER
jgi:hypothetical protein